MGRTLASSLLALALPLAAAAVAPTQLVSGTEIAAAARAALEQRLADGATRSTIAVVGSVADATLGGGSVELRVQPIGGRLPRARVPVSVELRQGARTARTATVWFAIEASRDALVYADGARAGTAAGALPTARQPVDASRIDGAQLVDPAELPEQRLRRDVRAGAPVLRSDFEPVPAVDRNGRVRVELRRGGVSIATTGTSRQRGMLGELIEVLVDGADRACLGRVTARGVVQVER